MGSGVSPGVWSSSTARWSIIRSWYPTTWLFGPEFRPSTKTIEIDVTYECDLKCIGCNRSCGLAPDSARMNLDQISRFISESRRDKREWKRIRILGGEPLLHPQITEIACLVLNYAKESSHETMVEICTSGYGSRVADAIGRLPLGIILVNTHKTTKSGHPFENFNKAPRDELRFAFSDFSNGCWITEGCGLGLNRFGYYSCAVGAGIDRVLGYDVGLKELPTIGTAGKAFRRQMNRLCPWCGHFMTGRRTSSKTRTPLLTSEVSLSWKRAYERYKAERPHLSNY